MMILTSQQSYSTSQEYLLEVTVDNTTDVPSGRYSSEYYVGINELNSVNVSVYPNPATDEILIDGVKVATVSIRDTAGREVYSGTERVVNISELAAGTYVLSGVSREGQTFVQRISKI